METMNLTPKQLYNRIEEWQKAFFDLPNDPSKVFEFVRKVGVDKYYSMLSELSTLTCTQLEGLAPGDELRRVRFMATSKKLTDLKEIVISLSLIHHYLGGN